MYDVIIIGGGPAGLNAGLYCKRAGLNTLILDKFLPGGNLNNYPDIENVLGFGKIDSQDLLSKYLEHLELFNVEIKPFEEVTSIKNGKIKKVITAENEYECYSIILATGTTPRKLPIQRNGDDYIGNGVHYCAICDGALYKDKTTAVIGGGNSALENALYLSEICTHVDIVQNLKELTADKIIVERVLNNPKIDVHCDCLLNALYTNGEQMVVEYYTDHPNGKKDTRNTIICDGIFINIGLTPNVQLLMDLEEQIYLDNQGVNTELNMETNIPGIYAIGDVRRTQLRQVSTAIADGSIAAMSCANYIKELKENL